jgi:hypothetical protein
MTTDRDDDSPLLDELGEVLAYVDPVPAEVTLAARSALAWRRIDAELAELLHDSALETADASGTRSTALLRALSFEAESGLGLEIEISDEGDLRRVMGQVVPPAALVIVCRRPGGTTTVTSDGLGQFRFDAVPQGLMSLRCEPTHGAPIETGWLVI